MRMEGLPALLLTGPLDRLYAGGFETSDGAVLILPDRAFFITDSRYIEAAREKVTDAEVLLCTAENRDMDIVKKLLADAGVTRAGAQDESLSYSEWQRVQMKLGVELVPAQSVTISLREIKEQYEIDSIIAAQRIAEGALDYVLGFIKPGLTEKDVSAELEYRMTKGGAEGLAFETICVAGTGSSRPHGVPGAYELQKGDFITMDFGCKINGYCSDMTRTVALGEPSDEMKKVYDVVLRAQKAGCEAARPGVIGRDLDKVARDVIAGAGYGEYFGHSLGHSVGLYIHESPNASPKEDRPLPAGTVVTCEPGVYIPGRFGVRIEDMLHITENGSENLTKAEKELIVL